MPLRQQCKCGRTKHPSTRKNQAPEQQKHRRRTSGDDQARLEIKGWIKINRICSLHFHHELMLYDLNHTAYAVNTANDSAKKMQNDVAQGKE